MSAPAGSAEDHVDVTPITLSVPYYSDFALLTQTVRSIVAQRRAAVHVLICDDSPAGLDEVQRQTLLTLCGRLPARIVRNPENLGMARTWNRCLDEADTDLVTIVHGDDELEQDYAAEMVRLAAAHPQASALFCGARIIGPDRRPAFSFPDLYKELLVPRHAGALVLSGDRALASLMRGNYIFCPSVCYRRSQLGQRRFDPRYRMVLDMDLTTGLLLDGHALVGVPRRRLYRYRRHAENATQHLTRDLTRFREESAFYLDVARRAEQKGFARAASVARQRRIVKLNLLFCVVRDLRHGKLADGRRKFGLLLGELFGDRPAA